MKLGDCDKCNKPVMDGDARYTAMEPETYRHADCHDWRSTKELFSELRSKLSDLQRRLPLRGLQKPRKRPV